MPVYVVTWNINKERANYDKARREFLEHLERLENTKCSGLDTIRWINNRASANEISNYLRQKLDNNDRLFVSRVFKSENSGWLDNSTWEWLNARL